MRALPSDRIGWIPRLQQLKEKASWVKRLFRWLSAVALLVFVLSLLAVVPFRWIDPPTSSFILQGESGGRSVLRKWATWNELGAAAIAAVAAEDQKFASHFGFDVVSIRESVDDYIEGDSLRGASTITQQVAKNLYLWPEKSFLRKGIEAYFAVLIEASWPKKRILEIYLNLAEFGPGIYGVGSASVTYFEKSPTDLSIEEAALLAAVLPNPKRLHVDKPSQYVRQRQGWIIEQIERLQREEWLLSLN